VIRRVKPKLPPTIDFNCASGTIGCITSVGGCTLGCSPEACALRREIEAQIELQRRRMEADCLDLLTYGTSTTEVVRDAGRHEVRDVPNDHGRYFDFPVSLGNTSTRSQVIENIINSGLLTEQDCLDIIEEND
jgi:hypothetical protein